MAQKKNNPVKRKRGRRYPYKARTARERERINQEIGEILLSVNDMIHKLVRKRFPHVDDDTRSEIVQECRIWLWHRSIPKYDAWRGVKISTYLYECIRKFVSQEVRRVMREQRHRHQVRPVDATLLVEILQSKDTSFDRRIEAIAEHIFANPSRYLTKAQATTFQAIMDNPDLMMKDIAEELGYQRASSLSMMVRRIRDRIASISIEEFEEDGSP